MADKLKVKGKGYEKGSALAGKAPPVGGGSLGQAALAGKAALTPAAGKAAGSKGKQAVAGPQTAAKPPQGPGAGKGSPGQFRLPGKNRPGPAVEPKAGKGLQRPAFPPEAGAAPPSGTPAAKGPPRPARPLPAKTGVPPGAGKAAPQKTGPPQAMGKAVLGQKSAPTFKEPLAAGSVPREPLPSNNKAKGKPVGVVSPKGRSNVKSSPKATSKSAPKAPPDAQAAEVDKGQEDEDKTDKKESAPDAGPDAQAADVDKGREDEDKIGEKESAPDAGPDAQATEVDKGREDEDKIGEMEPAPEAGSDAGAGEVNKCKEDEHKTDEKEQKEEEGTDVLGWFGEFLGIEADEPVSGFGFLADMMEQEEGEEGAPQTSRTAVEGDDTIEVEPHNIFHTLAEGLAGWGAGIVVAPKGLDELKDSAIAAPEDDAVVSAGGVEATGPQEIASDYLGFFIADSEKANQAEEADFGFGQRFMQMLGVSVEPEPQDGCDDLDVFLADEAQGQSESRSGVEQSGRQPGMEDNFEFGGLGNLFGLIQRESDENSQRSGSIAAANAAVRKRSSFWDSTRPPPEPPPPPVSELRPWAQQLREGFHDKKNSRPPRSTGSVSLADPAPIDSAAAAAVGAMDGGRRRPAEPLSAENVAQLRDADALLLVPTEPSELSEPGSQGSAESISGKVKRSWDPSMRDSRFHYARDNAVMFSKDWKPLKWTESQWLEILEVSGSLAPDPSLDLSSTGLPLAAPQLGNTTLSRKARKKQSKKVRKATTDSMEELHKLQHVAVHEFMDPTVRRGLPEALVDAEAPKSFQGDTADYPAQPQQSLGGGAKLRGPGGLDLLGTTRTNGQAPTVPWETAPAWL